MKTVLTIAGSDSGGGAGIQADIKTIMANGCYAMSAITSLTAQNTTGVLGIYDVTPDFLKLQLDAVFSDIFPDAVKIGMVSSSGLIETISNSLENYRPKHIVVDPVMVSTSGHKLISDDAVEVLKKALFNKAEIITPNIPEAEALSGISILNLNDMKKAAGLISNEYGCAVLCKGGHSINDANDVLFADGDFTLYEGKKIDNPNTHGTGCTLSSAIASNLAKDYDIYTSVKRAKDYISGALSDMLDLGRGKGPLNHSYDINSKFLK